MSAKAKSDQSKDEIIAERIETLRVATLRVQGSTDSVVQNCLMHAAIIQNACQANPRTVVTDAMRLLTNEQLKTIEEHAMMNNHTLSLATLTKAFFDSDYQSMQAKEKEMKYAREVCIAAVDLAFTMEFQSNSLLDQKRFRTAVSDIRERKVYAAGQQQGYAAASAPLPPTVPTAPLPPTVPAAPVGADPTTMEVDA